MELETFMREASVFNLTELEPAPIKKRGEYPGIDGWDIDLEKLAESFRELWGKEGDLRGQEVKPEHLDGIQKGDIVLMTCPFTGLEQP